LQLAARHGALALAAAQNPVASMASLPFQNNTYFGVGPNHNKTTNVLTIQPVLPFSAGEWNIISRTIAPLIYLPSIGAGLGATTLGENTTTASAGSRGIPETFGLGDINQTFYFSPAAPGFHLDCAPVSGLLLISVRVPRREWARPYGKPQSPPPRRP
jgi:hypothetical protein